MSLSIIFIAFPMQRMLVVIYFLPCDDRAIYTTHLCIRWIAPSNWRIGKSCYICIDEVVDYVIQHLQSWRQASKLTVFSDLGFAPQILIIGKHFSTISFWETANGGEITIFSATKLTTAKIMVAMNSPRSNTSS